MGDKSCARSAGGRADLNLLSGVTCANTGRVYFASVSNSLQSSVIMQTLRPCTQSASLFAGFLPLRRPPIWRKPCILTEVTFLIDLRASTTLFVMTDAFEKPLHPHGAQPYNSPPCI